MGEVLRSHRKGRRNVLKKDRLIEDAEEIMLNVGDDDNSDEVEPDEDDLKLCECQDSSGPVD